MNRYKRVELWNKGVFSKLLVLKIYKTFTTLAKIHKQNNHKII